MWQTIWSHECILGLDVRDPHHTDIAAIARSILLNGAAWNEAVNNAKDRSYLFARLDFRESFTQIIRSTGT